MVEFVCSCCFYKPFSPKQDQPGDDMTEIMQLMQEMQVHGNPPKEIMETLIPDGTGLPGMGPMPPMPPELADLDAQKMAEACKTQ
jgi:hypothetical protein